MKQILSQRVSHSELVHVPLVVSTPGGDGPSETVERPVSLRHLYDLLAETAEKGLPEDLAAAVSAETPPIAEYTGTVADGEKLRTRYGADEDTLRGLQQVRRAVYIENVLYVLNERSANEAYRFRSDGYEKVSEAERRNDLESERALEEFLPALEDYVGGDRADELDSGTEGRLQDLGYL